MPATTRSATAHDGHNEALPAPKSHAALALLAAAPLALPIDANINVIATAALAVYVGCWRSAKEAGPAESMSRKDAMKFPLIGSAVLVSLFVAFRFLPRHLVNAALTLYFVALGTAALAATVLPFVEAAFPAAVRAKSYTLAKGLRIPYALPDPTDVELTVPEAVAGAAAAVGCAWYGFRKHWLANNALGLAFSLTGIEHLSLGSVSTGAILLGGLFVYDVFWVFCTPVMVTVAKSFDAPIKLLFPRSLAAARGAVSAAAAAAGSAAAKKTASTGAPFSMLGLGDIVIPGIFVALLLRFDRSPARRGSRAAGSKVPVYFTAAFAGYVAGLVATIVVMNVFQAAQPALLYIVPAVLGAVGATAVARGEVAAVMGYSEEEAEGEEGDKKKAASPAKKGTPAKKRE